MPSAIAILGFALAECTYLRCTDNSDGGSAVQPIRKWKGGARLINRSADEQIRYVCSDPANNSEAKEQVAAIQRDISSIDSSLNDLKQKVQGKKTKLRDLQRKVQECKLALERAEDEAEGLRETLETQKHDSGKIAAYQASIEVITLTQLMAGITG